MFWLNGSAEVAEKQSHKGGIATTERSFEEVKLPVPTLSSEGRSSIISMMLTGIQLLFGWPSRIMSSCVGCNDVAVMLTLQNALVHRIPDDSWD